MRQRIRALERRLARQITELKVETVVEEFVDEYPDPDDPENEDVPPPDSLDIIERLTAARVFLPTFSHAIGYLDHCRIERIMPRSKHIINRLLPRLARTQPQYGYAT